MFGGILVHAMLFHFIFDFLFGAMHVGIPHSSSHGYGVAGVRRELDGLAVELPGGAIFGRELLFVSALGLRQTASQGADFGILILGETNRRNHQQRGYGDHTQQQSILHEVFSFLILRSGYASAPLFSRIVSSSLNPNYPVNTRPADGTHPRKP
jgi:hypothetical protein